MKTSPWIALFFVVLSSGFTRAAGDELQENENEILGSWQTGKSVVDFLPKGEASILEHGEQKKGTYEINGDRLFIRVEGEDVKSGSVLIEGDRMTVDEHEFRRVRPLDPETLIGRWTSDRADIALGAEGRLTVLEKSGKKGKAGRVVVVGREIHLTEANGNVEVKPFEIRGDTLIIDGVERLSRVGGEKSADMPLAGEWRHESGTVVSVTSDGRLEMRPGTERTGTFTVGGPLLNVKFDDGKEHSFLVAMDDGDLILDGEIRLTRVETAPIDDLEKRRAEEPEALTPEDTEAPVRPARTRVRVPSHPEPKDRFDASVNDFLDARMAVVEMELDGLGAKHPAVLRSIREARFLLKRCDEELELLGSGAAEGPGLRLQVYRNAFESEIAAWGSL